MPETQPNGRRSSAIAQQLAELEGLDVDHLRARYGVVIGQVAPAHLTKSLLQRIVAYRIQAAALGDLPHKTAKLLDRVAKSEAEGQGKDTDQSAVDDLIPPPVRRRVMPGAILACEYDGVVHRVTVLREGYAWNEETYPSLSSVARAITGTRWNGPRFFGLREHG